MKRGDIPFRELHLRIAKIAPLGARGRKESGAELREVTQIDRGDLSNLDFTPE